MLESTAVMDSLAEKFDDDDHQNDENGHADQQSGDSHGTYLHDRFLMTILAPAVAMNRQLRARDVLLGTRTTD